MPRSPLRFCWTRLDNLCVILWRELAAGCCVVSSYPPVFTSFLIVCLSSLSRQGSANRTSLHVPAVHNHLKMPVSRPLIGRGSLASYWSVCWRVHSFSGPFHHKNFTPGRRIFLVKLFLHKLHKQCNAETFL